MSLSPSVQLSQMGLPYDDLESQTSQGSAAQKIQDRLDSLKIIGAALARDKALDAGLEFQEILNTNTVQPGGPMFFPRLVSASEKAYENFEQALTSGDLTQVLIMKDKMDAAREAQGLPPTPPLPSYFEVLKHGNSILAQNARWLQDLMDEGRAKNFTEDPLGSLKACGAL